MPIRFMTPIPLPPQEFIEPNATDAFIWWLFKHRCVVCRKEATEINEIEPRSRSKKNLHDWRNRVCVCRECHNEYHKHGVNDEAIAKMKEQRKNFLLEMGREEYVEFYAFEEVKLSVSDEEYLIEYRDMVSRVCNCPSVVYSVDGEICDDCGFPIVGKSERNG